MSKVIVDEIQTDTTNGNVRVIPNGTGVLEVKGAGGDDGTLQLNCSAQSHGVKLKSPAHSAGQSYTMILPDNQIAQDKFLKVKSITGSGATAVGQLEYADVALPSTLTGAANLSGLLREQVKIVAGKLDTNSYIYLEDGMVHYYTTAETTSITPNITYSSSTTLDSVMSVGETVSVTVITTRSSATPHTSTFLVDNNTVTTHWVGGSAPTDGGTSGVDIFTNTIIKTGSATFINIANLVKTS
ncbi:MAG: hypothetical protein CMF91_00325 [Candidatus Marinimicrobia bacterium]|nr:hypothetical protein [Candidatus Neomarinimicrobiota bacterium]|tara:strand:- start:3869 stop:4594 length:726 start_codon:yes stop_codon:yes gene_type:complete